MGLLRPSGQFRITSYNVCYTKLLRDPKFSPAILPGPSPVDSPSRRAYKKRLVTQRSCFRLAASGLPGTNLAVEYIYGKYIRNLATSTIRQSGSVLLYFLHFLEQEGTTVYTLTSQDIGKYSYNFV